MISSLTTRGFSAEEVHLIFNKLVYSSFTRSLNVKQDHMDAKWIFMKNLF